MPGSVFLLDSGGRLPRALGALDPLRGDPIVRWLDPPARSGRTWLGALGRFAACWLFVIGFIVVGVASGVPWLGNGLTGTNGLVGDYGAWEQYLGLAAWWALVILFRRVFGLLVLDLEADGIVEGLQERLRAAPSCGPILGFFEWATRLSAWRCVFWLTFLASLAVWAEWQFVHDGIRTFLTHPATPGSFFYPLHAGTEQPTLTGLVSVIVVGTLHNYPIVLAARLCVVFAIVCKTLASEQPRIVPHHPDGTGGLLAVGRTSLLLSLFPVLAGLGLATNLLQVRLRLLSAGRSLSLGADMVPGIAFGLGLYFILAPLLFLLPLVPLRQVMGNAKAAYLRATQRVMAQESATHQANLRRGEADPEGTERLESMHKLYEYGQEMAVWPFDRRTLLRFVGVTLGPLAPLLGPWFDKVAEPIRRLLLGG